MDKTFKILDEMLKCPLFTLNKASILASVVIEKKQPYIDRITMSFECISPFSDTSMGP